MLTNQLCDYSHVQIPLLHQAAALGDTKKMQRHLKDGHSVHELDRYVGAAPLHYAAQNGSIEIAKVLLSHGAHLNIQCATHGMTPLMVAVWHRHLPLVEYLLSLPQINVEIIATVGIKARDIIGFGIKGKGTSFDQMEAQKLQQLFQAAKPLTHGNLIFDVILDQSLNEKNKIIKLKEILSTPQSATWINAILPISNSGNDAHTPLLIAARDGLAEVVQLLLEHGADQTLVDYYMRSLPIHKAAYGGHAAVLEALIQDHRITQVLNAQGPFNGYTPLHDAIWHGHYEAAKVLLNAGAETDLRGYDGHTALELAQRFCYCEITQLF